MYRLIALTTCIISNLVHIMENIKLFIVNACGTQDIPNKVIFTIFFIPAIPFKVSFYVIVVTLNNLFTS